MMADRVSRSGADRNIPTLRSASVDRSTAARASRRTAPATEEPGESEPGRESRDFWQQLPAPTAC